MLYRLSLIGIFLFLLIIGTASNRPDRESSSYFSSPIEHTPSLSGTFGELRWFHFHTGLDYKSSDGSAGDPVFAVQNGWVSRVKVEEDGYGRALYIDHPNGFTSVYAHLQSFSKEIEEWIREQQYKRESFAIDLYPPDSLFRTRKGEQIGRMGNAGSSSGVHLHFELRDTKSEIPCNPLLLGYEIQDTRAPAVLRLKWTLFDEQYQSVRSEVIRVRSAGSESFTLRRDTLFVPAGQIGLALQCQDQLDGAWNRNGIYGLRMYRDSTLSYSFQMRCIAFDQSRYLNAHIDFSERYHNRRYYHRLHQLPGNQLDIYDAVKEGGYLNLDSGETARIQIEVFDVAGNTSRLDFPVKATTTPVSAPSDDSLFLDPASFFTRQERNLTIHLPENSLYRPVPWSFSWNGSKQDFPEFRVLKPDIPLHERAILQYSLDHIPARLWSRAHFERLDHGRWEYAGGTLKGHLLTAEFRQLGTIRLAIDSTPPTIRPRSMSRNLAGWNQISFRIDDAAGAHPLEFEGCIDGRWILMEYDEKNRLLSHHLSDTLAKGAHYFELTVWDDRSNDQHYALEFHR